MTWAGNRKGRMWLTGQELPCLRLIPSWDDFPVTLAACVFHHSAPSIFPGLPPPGDQGLVVEVSARGSPPRLSPRQQAFSVTEMRHWWAQEPLLLLSFLSFCIYLWPFPSFNQQENKWKKNPKKTHRMPSCSSHAKLQSDCQTLKNWQNTFSDSPSFPLLSEEIINKNDSCVGGGRTAETEHQEMDKVFPEACRETIDQHTRWCVHTNT